VALEIAGGFLKSPRPLFLSFMESRDRHQVAAIEVVPARAAETAIAFYKGRIL
jgi:hypothetical protein